MADDREGGIVTFSPYGTHIDLTCRNHPDLRWNTKNIGAIGMRHIFYQGGLTEGSSEPDYSILPCQCPERDLIPVIPASWPAGHLDMLRQMRAAVAEQAPDAFFDWPAWVHYLWALVCDWSGDQAVAYSLGNYALKLPPLPPLPEEFADIKTTAQPDGQAVDSSPNDAEESIP